MTTLETAWFPIYNPLYLVAYVLCLFAALSFGYLIMWIFQIKKSNEQKENDNREELVLSTRGYLEGYIVLFYVKEDGKEQQLLDLSTSRYFFQPSYVHLENKISSIGLLLNVGDEQKFEYPIKGNIMLNFYQNKTTGHTVKGKMVVVMNGHGKESFLQANGVKFNYVREMCIPYDFSSSPLNSIQKLQPTTSQHGICSFIKREEHSIRFVKGTTESLEQHHHQLLEVAGTGFFVPSNYFVAWVPNQALVDPPCAEPPLHFLIPESIQQKLTNDQITKFDDEDITDKIDRWLDTIADSEKTPFKSRNRSGFRLSDSFGMTLQENGQDIASSLASDLSVFLSPFAVKRSEALGRGIVLIQSVTPLESFKTPFEADENQNRQWVASYSSQKTVKQSSNPILQPERIDKEALMKSIGEYNPKTHMVLVINAGQDVIFVTSKLCASFDNCKKCTSSLGEADALLINWDLQLQKAIACKIAVVKEAVESSNVPSRKRR